MQIQAEAMQQDQWLADAGAFKVNGDVVEVNKTAFGGWIHGAPLRAGSKKILL
jgi:ABC-type phosphate transport system ATPase subunit